MMQINVGPLPRKAQPVKKAPPVRGTCRPIAGKDQVFEDYLLPLKPGIDGSHHGVYRIEWMEAAILLRARRAHRASR